MFSNFGTFELEKYTLNSKFTQKRESKAINLSNNYNVI